MNGLYIYSHNSSPNSKILGEILFLYNFIFTEKFQKQFKKTKTKKQVNKPPNHQTCFTQIHGLFTYVLTTHPTSQRWPNPGLQSCWASPASMSCVPSGPCLSSYVDVDVLFLFKDLKTSHGHHDLTQNTSVWWSNFLKIIVCSSFKEKPNLMNPSRTIISLKIRSRPPHIPVTQCLSLVALSHLCNHRVYNSCFLCMKLIFFPSVEWGYILDRFLFVEALHWEQYLKWLKNLRHSIYKWYTSKLCSFDVI